MDVLQKTIDDLVPITLQILGSAAIFLLGQKLAQLTASAARSFFNRKNFSPGVENILGKLVYYLLLVVTILVALDNLDSPLTDSLFSILAFVIVALFYGYGWEHLVKIQEIFVRIFGEYAIVKDNINNITANERLNRLSLFNEGDAVEVAGGVVGTVKEIQDYYTILITFDGQTVIIPNTMITSNKIINYRAESNRRIDLIFGIGYDDDLLKAKLILQEIINGVDFVLDDPAPLIGVKELAESSVNFLVRIYVKREDFVQATLEITEQVKLKFDEARIGIPYPQQEIHLHQVK